MRIHPWCWLNRYMRAKRARSPQLRREVVAELIDQRWSLPPDSGAARSCRRLARELMSPMEQAAGWQFIVPYCGGMICCDAGQYPAYKLILGSEERYANFASVLTRLVQPGDTCLDIGANVGMATVPLALAVGRGGRVVAVEPHPQVAARLRENLAINNLKQVQVIEAALCSEDGPVVFYGFPTGAKTNMRSSLTASAWASEPMQVRGLTGASLTSEVGLHGCDLIKTDVQGHDLEVIRQLAGLIEEHRPRVIFEYAPRTWKAAGACFEEVADLFGRWHYRLWLVGRASMRPAGTEDPRDLCDIVAVPAHGGQSGERD